MSINAQPFNPTFKLTGNLQQDQVLVYDVSENAFVNATGSGTGGAASSIDTIDNTGTGYELANVIGTTLEMRSILAGENVSILDNGEALVVSASFEESIQSGTNLGAGTGVYSGVDTSTNQLQFKSIRVMGDLTLADDGQTITISYNGSGSSGGIDPTNNLSDLTDVAAARTNLEVISEAEANAKYLRLDAHSLPSQDNMWDIGSSQNRFNDIYAETLQGTAVLAENLTIAGTDGDVLTYSGGRWVAGQVTSEGTSVTPELTISGNEITITGGNTITLPVYADEDNYIKLDGHSLPTQDNVWDIGSSEHRFNDIYAETLQGTAVLAENLTINGGEGDVLTRIGGTWVARPASQAQIDLSDYATTDDLNTAISVITIPTDVSDLTDTTGLLGQGSTDLTGYATEVFVTNAIAEHATQTYVDTKFAQVSSFSGDYNDLTNKPTIPTVPTDISQLTDTTSIIQAANTDSQTLTLTGTTLQISGGNSVDLSAIDTNVDLTGYATQQWVIDQGFLTTDNDNQGLVLTGTTLTITGSTTSIDLSTIIPTPFSGDYNDLTNVPSSSSVSVLSDLTNVSDNTPADGQHLVFDGATNQWKPSAASEGSDSGYGDADARNAITSGLGLSYNSSTGTMALNASLSNLLDVDTTGITNGQVIKWNGSEFVPGDDTVLTSTDQLAEGTANLWYSDARVDNVINQKTSSDIAEGANLYFTSDRVNAILDSNIIAGTGINIVTGSDNVKTISADVFSGSYNDLTDTPTLFDGQYTSLTGTPTIPADVSDLTDTTNLLDHYTDADVSTYLGGNVNTHIIPDTNEAYDLGSATHKFRDLYLSAATIYLDDKTISKNAQGDLLYDGYDLRDFTQLKNKPDLGDLPNSSANRAIKLNDLADVALSADYADLTNTPTIPTDLSDFTDTTGLLGAGSVDLTNYYTKTEVDGLIPTVFSGSYNDLTDIPVIPDITGLVSETYVDTAIAGVNTFSGDYNDLTNKPTIPTVPTDISELTDTTGIIQAANTDSQTLTLTGSTLQISGGNSVDLSGFGGSTDLSQESINALNDVDTTGIQNGQFLSWNGTRFVATAQSGADLSLETLSELGDVATDSPVNGDSLVWNGSAWAPQAVSGGSGSGGGTTAEYFKLNYSTSGSLESITNTTSGLSATIVSQTGGDVEIVFDGYTFPPAGVLIYGYSRATNEYNMTPLNKDITTRKIAGGGSAGSPTAFGAMGSLTLTLKLREAETGASRSFGTPTHAWVMFTMI